MDSSEPPSFSESQVSGGLFGGLCTTPLAPNQRPGHLEINLPPAALLVVFLMSILYLIWSDKRAMIHRNRTFRYLQPEPLFTPPSPSPLETTGDLESRDPESSDGVGELRDGNDDGRIRNTAAMVEKIIGEGDFLSAFDHEVLASIGTFYNQPRTLLKICLPAFLSLILTAITLMLYQPITSCLWPGSGVRPDVNTAITCFLAPAGLIYALSFGFTFQQVLEKHRGVLAKITGELSMLDQLATMSESMRLPTVRHKMATLKAIKSEVIFLACTIQKRDPEEFKQKAPYNLKVHIWGLLDVLRDAASQPEYNFNLNRILADKMLKYMIALNNICIDRLDVMHVRIHPLKWVFLEVLGSLVVIGVMLVDANSRRLELTMCEVTIFSISMLCYVLADLDSPFNGFFRVDLDVLPEVTARLERMFEKAKQEEAAKTLVTERGGTESDRRRKAALVNNNHIEPDSTTKL